MHGCYRPRIDADSPSRPPGEDAPSPAGPDGHGHHPVLVTECLALLEPRPGEVVLDCTAGRGGHAEAFARAVGSAGRMLLVDLDPANLAWSRRRIAGIGPAVDTLRGSFVGAPARLEELGLKAGIVFADLGFSSNQIDDPSRGFGFDADGPLDMRLDPAGPVTAADLVARSSADELASIIRDLGEEPLAWKIAQKLVAERAREPILSTTQLAGLVREAYGGRARTSRRHPATRTFMALRIAVNDELGALRGLLDLVVRAASHAGEGWLDSGARVGIISFHSLEDRMVKRTFADLERRGLARKVTKRPVQAGEEEIASNPRARSARLRIVTVVTMGA